LVRAALAPGDAVSGEDEALRRMELAQPRRVADRIQARLLKAALRRTAS
jgi:hypothetical protein